MDSVLLRGLRRERLGLCQDFREAHGAKALLSPVLVIKRLPTDLVGQIYKAVELDDLDEVAEAVHTWIREDLALGSCPDCAGVPCAIPCDPARRGIC